MKELSNSDYKQIIHLLRFLASQSGVTRKEKEASRKAYLLARKMEKRGL